MIRLYTFCLIFSLSVVLYLITVPIAQAQAQGAGVFDFFCQSVRAGVASGPQQYFCLFQGLNNAINNLQQQQQLQQQQCPTGTMLQGNTCIPFNQFQQQPTTCPINTVLINGICQTQMTQLPPIANAGPSQTVPSASIVTLDGTASFAQNGAAITSFLWNQISGTPVSLNGANTATPTFTAPTVNSTTTTTVSFNLVVTDSNGLVSAPSSVTITITPQL
jgi:hypothetical protein